MFTKKILFAAGLLTFSFTYSQKSESKIDTVFIFDNQIKKLKDFIPITTLKPSDIKKNSANLSDVLRFQSSVYIKENGRGATSSPSFRGTTAQQTAFVWNGININSAFLGQGDINNIGFLIADQIDIQPGGGSVIYGSGAIGGTIHLNNELKFNKGFNGAFFSQAGSYQSYNNLLKTTFSNDKLSASFSANYNISQNDYEVSKQYINRNGKYFNTDFNFGIAYKVAPYHQLSWISETYNSTQHYPIFEESQTKTKNIGSNFRSLLAWDFLKQNLENRLKLAYTEDNFSYYNNISKPRFSGGIGRNYIIKNDFNYLVTEKWNLNFLTEFQNNQGEGYQSGITKVSRNVFSTAGLIRYFPSNKMKFEAGIKKDFVQDITSPLLFSLRTKWDVSKIYQLSTNISRNFRFPTFNDLYWQPGGNLNLKSETSYQFEINNQFQIGNFSATITPYYISIKDMIRWVPSNLGYWAPVNTDAVQSYGLETKFNFHKKWNKQEIKTILSYSYTKSIDNETNLQLMYVPLHKAFGSIDYTYSFVNFYTQGMYNGLTYTSSDGNKKSALQPYFIFNSGINFNLFKNYKLGFRVNNIFNEKYQSIEYYYMPLRNYNFYINIKF